MVDPWRPNFGHMDPRAKRDGNGLVLPRSPSGTRDWTGDRCLDCRKVQMAMGFLVNQYFRRLSPDPRFPLLEGEYVFQAPHYAKPLTALGRSICARSVGAQGQRNQKNPQ